jgi:hypothetical protein
MPNKASKYEIAYNSDLIIQSHSELAALCIYYDRILLASTSSSSCADMISFEFSLIEEGERASVNLEPALEIEYVDDGISLSTRTDVPKWDQEHRSLFDENVLQRLPSAADTDEHAMIEMLTDDARNVPSVLFDGPNMRATIDPASGTQAWRMRLDLVAHMLRDDLDVPAVFNLRDRAPQREFLKALQIRELFNYFLPATTGLPDDEILEIRRQVSDTREGFGMHLQKLSSSIDAALKGGESYHELERLAQNLVETQLIPDYVEFRRQLAAERTSIGGRILDMGGRVLEIDAPPWTPKFYGQMLKAFGFVGEAASEKRKDSLSNRLQAFQYIRRVDEGRAIRGTTAP